MKFDPVKSLTNFYSESRRVLAVSIKPTNDEFMRTLKIVLLGVLVLGLLGFVISFIVGKIAS